MKFSIAVLASILSLGLANPVPSVAIEERAQSIEIEPDPTQVWFQGVTYGGTGCPQNSASISLAPDRKSFTVIFDAYVATAGPGFTIRDERKNCQLNVIMMYPGGFQYSILSSDYRGYVDLDKAVIGTQKATYYFGGETAQASSETTYTGPKKGDYVIHDVIPFSSTVWSPCGAPVGLNINSQVRVDASKGGSGAKGLLTTDSIDGKVTFQVGVQWQTCTKKN